MLVLGIETSCDETAAAVVKNGKEILSNTIASQADLHRQYGGVFPELACRHHVDLMLPVIDQALLEANTPLSAIDLIAVAHGPGLIGALLIGLNAAKGLSFATGIPFIGVNHVEAHLFAALMAAPSPPSFPCLGVVLSGGHTALLLAKGVGNYQLIGETVDDAIGEAFDKVAKMLGLSYPGGPEIEKLARVGDPSHYPFKAGRVKQDPFAFSFSGLKTSVLYTIRGQNGSMKEKSTFPEELHCHIAASFQEAAFRDVIDKIEKAARAYGCKEVLLGGGVTHNERLRQLFGERLPSLTPLWPAPGLSLDNAAMIAGLGYHHYQERKSGDPLSLEPLRRIPFVS